MKGLAVRPWSAMRPWILGAAMFAAMPLGVLGGEPTEWAKAEMPRLIELYRHFHMHPELSFQEKETAKTVADHLRDVGADVTEGVGGHGVVALLRNGDGPTVMVRTDLDALPVAEQTGLVYASTAKVVDASGAEVGVMHACGHDIHMTTLIGVARYLAQHKDKWRGTVMFIGQPAEERGAGAAAMLDDGLFTRFPKPDFALALHVTPELAAGMIGYCEGYSLANVDSVDITMKGRGGHGAYPHTTVDPIVQAAELVLSLQTIVSREVNPIEPAVVTVGSIHAGTKHNIIGDSCHLQLTVRSYSEQVRRQLLDAIRRKALAVAQGARAPEPEVTVSEGTPALWNDPDLLRRILPAMSQEVGEQNAVKVEPSMGGEDFSRYGLAGVPSLMYRLGSIEGQRLERMRQLGQAPPSLHSPVYYPDPEPTLATGIGSMAAAVLSLLEQQPAGNSDG